MFETNRATTGRREWRAVMMSIAVAMGLCAATTASAASSPSVFAGTMADMTYSELEAATRSGTSAIRLAQLRRLDPFASSGKRQHSQTPLRRLSVTHADSNAIRWLATPAHRRRPVVTHLGDLGNEGPDFRQERREVRSLPKAIQVRLGGGPLDPQDESIFRFFAMREFVGQAFRRRREMRAGPPIGGDELGRCVLFQIVADVFDDHCASLFKPRQTIAAACAPRRRGYHLRDVFPGADGRRSY